MSPYVLSFCTRYMIAEPANCTLLAGELLSEGNMWASGWSERETCTFHLYVAQVEVGARVLGWRKDAGRGLVSMGGGEGLGTRVEEGAWEQGWRRELENKGGNQGGNFRTRVGERGLGNKGGGGGNWKQGWGRGLGNKGGEASWGPRVQEGEMQHQEMEQGNRALTSEKVLSSSGTGLCMVMMMMLVRLKLAYGACPVASSISKIPNAQMSAAW